MEDWLEPLSYIDLWDAIEPYRVFTEADRDHCDGLIAGGKVKQALILECIKAMAEDAITEKLGLKHRIIDPVNRQYLLSTN